MLIDTRLYDAALFDLDGVVTKTAAVHKKAWKTVFDQFLFHEFGPETSLFDMEGDYLSYVDGKPRYEGVSSFLASRGMTLATGDPSDSPDARTVCGVGNKKNIYFNEQIRLSGVDVYPTTIHLIEELKRVGLRIGLVTSSRNAEPVMRAAEVEGLFDTVIDGTVAAERDLPGKPDPATFLAAGSELGVEPGRTIVVEDAIAGVAAARAGRFGLVIGLARSDNAADILAAGAHVVVGDLAEVDIEPMLA